MGQRDPMEMAEEVGTQYFEVMQRMPSRVYYFGAVTSLMGSAMMFLAGRRNLGMFFGQLATNLLILPLFHRLTHPERERTTRGLEEVTREAQQRAREFTGR